MGVFRCMPSKKDELLNPVSETQISDATSFSTASRIKGQVLGLYSSLQNGQMYAGRVLIYGDIKGEDFLNEGSNLVTGFDVWNLVLLIIVIYGSFSIAQAKEIKGKLISGVVVLVALIAFFIKYANMPGTMNIQPQIFQHFNPCFVVALTPFSILLFGTLAKKGKEPSAPRKIGLGMLVAAIGFSIMAAGSVGQVSPADLKDVGGVSQALVSPNWLISTYLVLTFAELLLSPMGISFVSKVAPPKYKGMMMGGWFVATAIGNYATSIIGHLWSSHLALWMVWSVLIILCVLSALFMFSIMKKLEKVAK